MARARKFLRPFCGSQNRNAGASSAVWAEGIDYYSGSLRCRRWNIPSRYLQLDGSRLPVRKGSGQHLVGRTSTRRRGLTLCSAGTLAREVFGTLPAMRARSANHVFVTGRQNTLTEHTLTVPDSQKRIHLD